MLLGFKDTDGVFKELIGTRNQLKSLYQQLVLIGYADTEEEFLNKMLSIAEGNERSSIEKLINDNLELIKNNQKEISKKVDKEYGKDLSTNDLTNELLNKLNKAFNYSISDHSYNDLIDKPIIPSTYGLASEEYVNNKLTIHEENVAEKIYDGIKLKDSSTSYNYILEINNGVLRTRLLPSDIVPTLDTSTLMNGDFITPEKIIKTMNLEFPDGTTEALDSYNDITFEPEYITKSTTEITVNYKMNGVKFSKTVSIENHVIDVDPAVLLKDFNYTSNSDGTYTLTGWKQTLNGVSSTELVVPKNLNIKL